MTVGDGLKTVYVQYKDSVGSESASFSDTITLDQTVPAVSGEVPVRDSTIGSLSSVSVTFSEAVTGVVAGDLAVNGSPATNVTGTGAGPYVFSGYTAPPAGTVTVTLAAGAIQDVTGNPFNGDNWIYNLSTVLISGYIRSVENWNIFGVQMTATNGGGSAVTDSSGHYELTVPYGWSGTVTPAKPDWHFTPLNTVYEPVTSNTSTNYTATPDHIGGDANGDGVIDFSDYVLLSNNFGAPGEWAQGDFNGDGVVNFSDYLIFQTSFSGD